MILLRVQRCPVETLLHPVLPPFLRPQAAMASATISASRSAEPRRGSTPIPQGPHGEIRASRARGDRKSRRSALDAVKPPPEVGDLLHHRGRGGDQPGPVAG